MAEPAIKAMVLAVSGTAVVIIVAVIAAALRRARRW